VSAPVLWILVPGLAALLLYLLRRQSLAIHISASLLALILAVLAWQLDLGRAISLDLWPTFPTFTIGESASFLGRNFTLDDSNRPALILIYFGTCFWLAGGMAANSGSLFAPLGLTLAPLATAAIAIEPSLFSILLIETLALTSVPILSPPGKPIQLGVLRLLTFQTIGICIILIGDWLLPIVEALPGDTNQAVQAGILIGLGFALVDAIFPFHAWVPMLAEKAKPYSIAFFLFFYPTTISLIGLKYLSYFNQFSIAPQVYSYLQIAGTAVILFGGLWAAFQSHLGRILGFTAITQIGLTLIIFSLGSRTDLNPLFLGLFYAQLAPLLLNMAIWGLSLHAMQDKVPNLSFFNVRGLARRAPIASTGVLLSNFSLAGLPLLTNFPLYVIVWSAVSEQSLTNALIILIGNGLLFVAGLRSLAVLTMSDESGENWRISERGIRLALISIGCLVIFALGILPQVFLPPMINLAFIYNLPGP
jgi:formate hydrogenlyase subunit 3/multisubunit Na+/H+ antiporter MnhD subunit